MTFFYEQGVVVLLTLGTCATGLQYLVCPTVGQSTHLSDDVSTAANNGRRQQD